MARADPGRSVRIPFKVVDGALKYYYGGRLPGLREGTVGDLAVPRSALLDAEEWKRLNQERTELLLAADTLIGVGHLGSTFLSSESGVSDADARLQNTSGV